MSCPSHPWGSRQQKALAEWINRTATGAAHRASVNTTIAPHRCDLAAARALSRPATEASVWGKLAAIGRAAGRGHAFLSWRTVAGVDAGRA